MLGLIIPTSDTDGVGDVGGFVLPEDNRSSAIKGTGAGEYLDDADEGFNIDPGFIVDKDGNLIITENEVDTQNAGGDEFGSLNIGGLLGERLEGGFHDDHQEVGVGYLEPLMTVLTALGTRLYGFRPGGDAPKTRQR